MSATLAHSPRPETHTQPSILFLCPAQWGVRNVVHSGMVADLRRRGMRVHVLAGKPESYALWYPELRHGNYTATQTNAASGAEAGETWDVLHTPPVMASPRGWSTLEALQRASFFRRYNINTDSIYYWWFDRNLTHWERSRNAVVRVLATIGSRQPFFGWQSALMQHQKRRIWDGRPARQLLQQLRPAMVVATSCVMWAEEPYLLAARALDIPTLGCPQSFDSLTSRSFIPPCDDYAVWNGRMRDQLLRFYPHLRAEQVHITGTPQFDFHVRNDFRWNRAATLAELGLQPHDRYILYAANFYFHTPTEPQLVTELVRRTAQIPELAQQRIVIRLHPLDDYARWNSLAEADPRVVISRPSANSRMFASPTDQARLVSTLLHADVCLNMWSTMSLDAAAVDTPVVCVAFAGQRGGLEDRFCRVAYQADFYRPIVDSGGVQMAYDMPQLLEGVLAYTRDRSRHHAARRRLAIQECGLIDGRAAMRVADLVAALAARSSDIG